MQNARKSGGQIEWLQVSGGDLPQTVRIYNGKISRWRNPEAQVKLQSHFPRTFLYIRQILTDQGGLDYVRLFRALRIGTVNLSNRADGGGMSGSAMFFSACGSFLIKDVRDYEFDGLCDRHFLSSYCEHLQKHSDEAECGGTAIERFVGAFKVHLGSLITLRLVVSVKISLPSGIIPGPKYDLKGTCINRTALPSASGSKTFLDNDLRTHTEFCRSCLHLTPLFEMLECHQRVKMTRRIENAVSFLQHHGRLDYSLLVFVGYDSNESRRRRRANSELHEERAYTAFDVVLRYVVIDTLTAWSARKVLEYYLCRIFLGCYFGRSMKFGRPARSDEALHEPLAAERSRRAFFPWDVVPPTHYGRRFNAMIQNILQTSPAEEEARPPRDLQPAALYVSAASCSSTAIAAGDEQQHEG